MSSQAHNQNYLQEHGPICWVLKLDCQAFRAGCRAGSGRVHHAAVQLDLQGGLEAGDDGHMLLHVCSQHHVNHQLAQPYL